MNVDMRPTRPSGFKNTDIDPDIRSEYERDLDRLYYTYYFRRLAETTQVASYSASESNTAIDRQLLHNRITHSLKVGQVARRLAQYLIDDKDNAKGIETAGGLDPDVVQAAGLAHDLGHPPFGHVGEEELDSFARSHGLADGFEGNAQTFRILTSITQHLPVNGAELVPGLDLTRATTAACMKYPRARGKSGKEWRKFGYYNDDAGYFRTIVAPLLPRPECPTLEAEIMDWADDITYAVHDLEDFSLAGSVPLTNLRHTCENPSEPRDKRRFTPVNNAEWQRFWDYAQHRIKNSGRPVPSNVARRIFGQYAALFPLDTRGYESFSDTSVARLGSELITDSSKATSVPADGRLQVDEGMRSAIDLFQQLTWCYVIDHHELVATQRGHRRQLRELCEELYRWAKEVFSLTSLPPWNMQSSDASPRNADDMSIAAQAMPPRLSNLIDSSLRAKHLRSSDGPPGERDALICRGVLDYVASLREREVGELRAQLIARG